MSKDLFIYYLVPAEHAVTMQKKVTAMQAELREHWPVAASLKRRPELKEGCETWMEIYTRVHEDFPAALESAVHQSQLLALTKGQRHIEIFVDIPGCA